MPQTTATQGAVYCKPKSRICQLILALAVVKSPTQVKHMPKDTVTWKLCHAGHILGLSVWLGNCAMQVPYKYPSHTRK